MGISAWPQVSLSLTSGSVSRQKTPGPAESSPARGSPQRCWAGARLPPRQMPEAPRGGRLAAARSPLPHSRVRGGAPTVAIGPIASPQGGLHSSEDLQHTAASGRMQVKPCSSSEGDEQP
ncbi:uncharacterized protein LOC107052874 isoform X1 [Gallus gallus]|uniref:uncharacterized protein LOC107052874 isoform X1 n=1 Tax=Gallus gallus TaxID=9031 RepID=UPI001F021472|nr:uncharacterized protein LOC107052874 isoform X1 [Gallus gallus]